MYLKTKKSNLKTRLGRQNQQEQDNFYKVEQIEELQQIFKMYDRDNTGRISSRTLKFLLRGLGETVRDKEIGQKLRDMDINKDGSIDFSEFLLYMREKTNKQNLYSDILEIFGVFDNLNTGYLTRTQIKNITRGFIDSETVQQFCLEADTEGSGEVDYERFFRKLLL